jgi:TolB-like protein/Tfp pilus assembly protein PilF
MASLIEGFNYDIFISYRQKDNKYDGWVTEFVDNLKKELEATFKEEISVYFDINPHDGLLETHDVDASVKDKLKCLVFIPIISRTYCDPKSFAWEHEFKAFVEQASNDQLGLKIKLPNGNFANRVLPIRIYDLENTDIKLCESVLGGVVRGIEFIYKSAGVNRPLTPSDYPEKNQYKTFYRDQINKVANAIKENISGLKGEPLEFESELKEVITTIKNPTVKEKSIKVTAGSKKRILLVSAVLLTAAVIFVALILTNVIKVGKVAKSEEIKSIAVLPFRNDSPEDSTQYFMDGVMEELLNKLQSVKSLRVLGRTSVEQFRGQNKSISEIAKELGVNFIVEGSGQKSGNALRMRVQLIRARNERHIWGNSFEQKSLDMREYFKAQSGFAEAIANELNAVLSPQEKKLLQEVPSVNLEAYDTYLKGYSYMVDLSSESLLKAKDYLNSAIEKDPHWAPLYSAMALVWWSIAAFGVESPEIAIPIIYDNINKAMKLDPGLVDVHFLNAIMAFTAEWDWEKTEKEFLTALSINPNHAMSRVWFSHALYVLQRPEEGLSQATLAIKLDPLNPVIQRGYAAALLCGREYKAAMDVLDNMLAKDPDDFLTNGLMENAALFCGDSNKSFKACLRYIPQTYEINEESINQFEMTYNKSGYYAAYAEFLQQLEILYDKKYVPPGNLAIGYYFINQDDKALKWIEKALEVHDSSIPYLGTGLWNCTRLYDNPRFIEVLKKINLPLPKN